MEGCQVSGHVRQGEVSFQGAGWIRDRASLTGTTPRSCQQEEGLTDSTVRQLGHPLFSSLNLPPSNQQRQKDHARQGHPSQNLAPPGSSTDPAPSYVPPIGHAPHLKGPPSPAPAPACVTHRPRPARGAPPAPGPGTPAGSDSGCSL